MIDEVATSGSSQLEGMLRAGIEEVCLLGFLGVHMVVRDGGVLV